MKLDSEAAGIIPDLWYPLVESRRIGARRPIGVARLGTRFVLWRARDGKVVCLPDRCPHRAAILSTGKLRDGCLECPYHGLRFDQRGKCVLIPANGVGAEVPQGFDMAPLRVQEAHGLIWYWHGDTEPYREVPWLAGGAEPGPGTAQYSYVLPVPYLRIVENLLDFHHFPILHKVMLPGIGTRLDELETRLEGDVVAFSAVFRYETPSRWHQDTPVKAWFTLPSLALIKLGSFDVNYALTPVDEGHCWIFARYANRRLGGALGTAVGTLGAIYDRMIFELQDKKVLRGQVDPPGDFSRFHLFEADRAIALLFGLRKRARAEAELRRKPVSAESVAAAGS